MLKCVNKFLFMSHTNRITKKPRVGAFKCFENLPYGFATAGFATAAGASGFTTEIFATAAAD